MTNFEHLINIQKDTSLKLRSEWGILNDERDKKQAELDEIDRATGFLTIKKELELIEETQRMVGADIEECERSIRYYERKEKAYLKND